VEDFQQLDASIRDALAGALAAAGLDSMPPPGATELMQPAVFSKLHEPLVSALQKVRLEETHGARGGVQASEGRHALPRIVSTVRAHHAHAIAGARQQRLSASAPWLALR
jgi:hypothetical protein